MNRDPLSYPPQMRNGGSPPAHLSSSSLSDPSWWLQYKWLQPPPHAPEWVINNYLKFNPPANVGRPLHNKEWLQRALCEDQQAANLLPPKLPGGPILLGARAPRNALPRIGSGRLMPCGMTSTTASKLQPANAILISKLLANNRRQLIVNSSLTSMLPTNARRPIVANDSSMSKQPTNARRPPIVNGFLTRRPLVANAFWMHAPPRHNGWRPQQLSSFGFVAAASKSASPKRLHGGSNVRLLLPACNTSRNAARARQWWTNGSDRGRPCRRKRWPMRLMSNVARRRPLCCSVSGDGAGQGTMPS
jgi:hypothetical protein